MKLSKAERAVIAKLLAVLVDEPGVEEATPARDAQHGRRSFSPAEIAKRNKLSVSYVYKEINLGRLKASRTGGFGPMRVSEEAESAWLEAGAVCLRV